MADKILVDTDILIDYSRGDIESANALAHWENSGPIMVSDVNCFRWGGK